MLGRAFLDLIEQTLAIDPAAHLNRRSERRRVQAPGELQSLDFNRDLLQLGEGFDITECGMGVGLVVP